MGGGVGAQEDVIQLADSLDGALQLLVVAQPLAHLGGLFAMDTELPGAAAGIADGENGLRMSFTTGTLGAAAGMTRGSFDEGAAQDLARRE